MWSLERTCFLVHRRSRDLSADVVEGSPDLSNKGAPPIPRPHDLVIPQRLTS